MKLGSGTLALLAAAAVPLATACGDDDGLEIASECNPLGGIGCVTPWPSSVYEIDDASTATGRRLDIAMGALPTNVDGDTVDPGRFNQRDGFTPATQLFTVFPERVDPALLTGPDDIAASVTDASATIIVDMETGERVAHFAEVDVNADDDEEQALYLRPAARLADGRRYAVAIRSTLTAVGGGPLTVPAGFQAILDGTGTDHERLERVRPRYDAIFVALEGVGVPRDELVVAWDFTTASEGTMTADMLGARDAALAAMGPLAGNMSYTVEEDGPYDDDPLIARRIAGTFEAPNLLAGPGGTLGMNRAADGTPVADGTAEFDFVIMVPSCATPASPAGILLFGHGFFGSLLEMQEPYMRRVADELCMVVVGTKWLGMSGTDLAEAALALNDGNKVLTFGERIIQGIVNHITLAQLVRGKIADELLVADPDGPGPETPAPVVEPARTFFYGISQGGILGTTFMAVDPSIERGVIGVGGGNWWLLFERSIHWGQYGTILGGAYPGALNMIIMEAVLQMGFDLTDPIHVAPRVLADPLPDTPDKQLLLYMAIDDAAVSNVSTLHLARSLDLPLLAPAVTEPYGLTATEGPLASALVIYDEDPEPKPHATNALNKTGNPTHGNLRTRQAVVDQIGAFLSTGEVIHTCGEGQACDCTADACGPSITEE